MDHLIKSKDKFLIILKYTFILIYINLIINYQ